MREMSPEQVRLARVASQRLTRRCADDGASAAQVLADVLGVQAQDRRAALAGVCLRRPGITAEEVERARVEERTIATTWLMRGTLHLVASEDLPWLLGMLGPTFAPRLQWRLRQLGISERDVDAAVAVIAETLSDRGPLTRAEIAGELVSRELLPDTAGQRPAHLIGAAATRGLVCVGPMRGAKATYAFLPEWLGVMPSALPVPEREAALVEFARRYLEAFGPAGPRDFAFWSGLPVREARTAFESVRTGAEEVRVGGETLLAMPGSRALTCASTDPGGERVDLPSWDNYLMGYADRSFSLGPGIVDSIGPNGGVLLHARLVDGIVVGRWDAG